jgi:hypothetical protein
VRFTRSEFLGKPWELALGFLVLFGSPLLMLYAMDAFPILDPKSSLLSIVALPVLVLSWGLCII